MLRPTTYRFSSSSRSRVMTPPIPSSSYSPPLFDCSFTLPFSLRFVSFLAAFLIILFLSVSSCFAQSWLSVRSMVSLPGSVWYPALLRSVSFVPCLRHPASPSPDILNRRGLNSSISSEPSLASQLLCRLS
ncbi:hypothetical protein E2C01_082664 [Portunus trituberculatus]|uniref:Uncharacterized protein n=1 Tax=Portunus trituberculatus TaxID=210409 RepID=A0A5B7IQJ1_PORTR|nr:hypothetical protein [Portunus trituberculatus]